MRVSEHSPSRAEENPSRHRALGPQRGEPACRRGRKKKVISSRLQAKVITRNLLYDPNKNGDCTEPINVRVNAKQSSIGGVRLTAAHYQGLIPGPLATGQHSELAQPNLIHLRPPFTILLLTQTCFGLRSSAGLSQFATSSAKRPAC